MGLTRSLAVTLVGMLTLHSWSRVNHAQMPAPLEGASLEHVGIVTRDIAAAARKYERIFGVTMSAPTTVTTEAPDGKVTFKTARLKTANFQLELVQPTNKNGLSAWLEKHGDGIQHVGLNVPGPLDGRIKQLQGIGGRLTLGGAGSTFAFVDLTGLIGTTLELTQEGISPAPSPASTGAAASAALALAAMPVSHIGLVVPSIDASVEAFAKMTGLAPPRIMTINDPVFPVRYAFDRHMSVRTATFRVGEIGLEFQQASAGRNPWNDFAARHGGTGVEYVAFRVGDQLTPMRHHLEGQGGAEAIGNAESGYCQYDFISPLGMLIELLGTPAPR